MTKYPWRTRLGWECRGFMYYIDVGEAECLDVARGLWLTGADYLSVWIREEGKDTRAQWRYVPTHGAYRGSQMGGYSER